MPISYLVATSAFAKGVALGFAAMVAAKACKNRQNGDKRRSSGQRSTPRPISGPGWLE